MTRKVAIIIGSDSDLPHLEGCFSSLRELEIEFEVRVMSAHRTPERAARFAREARDNGFGVLIAAAGGAAHLAGALAAQTVMPIIGIPIPATPLNGLDSLLSTVQMPPGIPVATVAIGSMGATNAAILAAQIIAVGDDAVLARVSAHRAAMAAKVEAKDTAVRAKYS